SRHAVSLTGAIEIIGVLVVAEEYGIDLPDLGCRARRTAELLQRDMRQLIFAWSVEGRIGEQAEAIGFDERGGPANESDHQSAHDTKTERANVDNVPHPKRNATSHLVNRAAGHQGEPAAHVRFALNANIASRHRPLRMRPLRTARRGK